MAVIWSLSRMAFSKCRQPDGRDRTYMRFCWQLCCSVHRSSHCMGKLSEFVFLVNGLQKWASWRFLDTFILAFLVRCPVDRGLRSFCSFLLLYFLANAGRDTSASGGRRIRISSQTRSNLGADAFVSGTRRARIWDGVRWKI